LSSDKAEAEQWFYVLTRTDSVKALFSVQALMNRRESGVNADNNVVKRPDSHVHFPKMHVRSCA